MERRKAITTAAAASLTLLAGAAGIALNSGIVGADGDDNVGQLSPVSTIEQPFTIGPASNTAGSTPVVRPTEDAPVTTSSASAVQSDDEADDGDDRYEDDHEDDDHEDDDHEEYEGADDDD